MSEGSTGRLLARRGILRALALAPAALAGCATAPDGPKGKPASAGDPAPAVPAAAPRAPPAAALAPGTVAAVRAFRLPADAEPAAVFRAAAARPGEPR